MAAAAEGPQCPVCLDLLFNAFISPCGHSVCEVCKDKIVKTKDGPRKCPECRKGVFSYKPNFGLRSVVEAGHPADHKRRVAEQHAGTVKGRLEAFLRDHPGTVVQRSDHENDALVLLLLTEAKEASGAHNAVNRIRARFRNLAVTVVVALRDVEHHAVSWSVSDTYQTRLDTPRFVVVLGTTAKDPLATQAKREQEMSKHLV